MPSHPAVLDDILGLMCTSRFIEELFRPQPIYSAQSLRTIFYRLAHSSIMRLNKQSMDKVGRSCQAGWH